MTKEDKKIWDVNIESGKQPTRTCKIMQISSYLIYIYIYFFIFYFIYLLFFFFFVCVLSDEFNINSSVCKWQCNFMNQAGPDML